MKSDGGIELQIESEERNNETSDKFVPKTFEYPKTEPPVWKEELSLVQAFRHFVWNMLQRPSSHIVARLWSLFIVLVVIWSTIIILIESLPEYYTENGMYDYWYIQEWVICGIFIFEYLIFVLCCPSLRALLMSPYTYLDLIAILPTFLYLLLDIAAGIVIILLRTMTL